MTGRRIYLPDDVLSEIEKIKKEKGLKGKGSDGIAAQIMAQNSLVGRNLERMMNNMSCGILPIPKSKKKRKKWQQ